jgi:hypothetical protein
MMGVKPPFGSWNARMQRDNTSTGSNPLENPV